MRKQPRIRCKLHTCLHTRCKERDQQPYHQGIQLQLHKNCFLNGCTSLKFAFHISRSPSTKTKNPRKNVGKGQRTHLTRMQQYKCVWDHDCGTSIVQVFSSSRRIKKMLLNGKCGAYRYLCSVDSSSSHMRLSVRLFSASLHRWERETFVRDNRHVRSVLQGCTENPACILYLAEKQYLDCRIPDI